jgi:hypothetical protein
LTLQTTVIGGRISDSTGHCEELTHSLAQNQKGYGHVDRINFIKAFQPAVWIIVFLKNKWTGTSYYLVLSFYRGENMP